MILAWVVQDLPSDSPFSPAVRLTVYTSLATFSLLCIILVVKIIIYSKVVDYLNEVKDLLEMIRGWAVVGREHRDKVEQRAEEVHNTISTVTQKVERVTEEVKSNVARISEAVVERIKEVVNPDSGRLPFKEITETRE